MRSIPPQLWRHLIKHIYSLIIILLPVILQANDKILFKEITSDSLLKSTQSSSIENSLDIDSMEHELNVLNENLTTSEKQVQPLFNLGRHYFNQAKYEEAQLIFKKIVAQKTSKTDWNILAASHNYLSLIAEFDKQYMELYYHNKKLVEYGEKYSPLWLAVVSLNLGSFYLGMDDLVLAEKMYVKGINIFQKLPKQSEYGWLLHRLGEVQRINRDFSKAEGNLTKALNYWKQTNNFRGASYTLLQLGELSKSLGRIDRAKKQLLESLQIAEKNEFWLSQIITLISLGNFSSQQGNHEEAILYLEKSADLSIEKNIPYHYRDSYQSLAENYEAIGKIQAANQKYHDYFKELEKTLKLNHSTTKEWARNMDNLMEKEHAYELLKKTDQLNQEKLKRQQTFIGAAILISLLAIWIAYSYFKTNQRNIKQKKNLEVLNLKIQEQANQLTIANENITQQKKELQIELVKKLLVLSKHSESVKSIETKLESMKMSKETTEIKKWITSAKDDSLWEELDIQLSQSNTEFFNKLTKRFPTLTQNDLRLCALLKINLRTKEIANLTFRNPESIKVARSRLRKKIGLTHSNTDISSFLNQL